MAKGRVDPVVDRNIVADGSDRQQEVDPGQNRVRTIKQSGPRERGQRPSNQMPAVICVYQLAC